MLSKVVSCIFLFQFVECAAVEDIYESSGHIAELNEYERLLSAVKRVGKNQFFYEKFNPREDRLTDIIVVELLPDVPNRHEETPSSLYSEKVIYPKKNRNTLAAIVSISLVIGIIAVCGVGYCISKRNPRSPEISVKESDEESQAKQDSRASQEMYTAV